MYILSHSLNSSIGWQCYIWLHMQARTPPGAIGKKAAAQQQNNNIYNYFGPRSGSAGSPGYAPGTPLLLISPNPKQGPPAQPQILTLSRAAG